MQPDNVGAFDTAENSTPARGLVVQPDNVCQIYAMGQELFGRVRKCGLFWGKSEMSESSYFYRSSPLDW